jgi:hypothetical protein
MDRCLQIKGIIGMLRFNAFGKLIGVERSGDHWKAYSLGNEGKFRDAGFIIPDNIREEEIPRYLADLFHESSSSERPGVFQIHGHH